MESWRESQQRKLKRKQSQKLFQLNEKHFKYFIVSLCSFMAVHEEKGKSHEHRAKIGRDRKLKANKQKPQKLREKTTFCTVQLCHERIMERKARE